MNRLSGAMFRAMIANGGLGLERHCNEVNDLNVFPVPDGDTGTNMTATMRGGIEAVSNISDEAGIAEIAAAIRKGMLLGARGNSGVILSQFFAGLCDALTELEEATVEEFAEAMQNGVKRAYEVVVTPVEGTILTVMREGCEAASCTLTRNSSFEDYFVCLQSKMKESLQNTPELLPVLKEAGVIDSGGAGLVYIVEGMAKAIGGMIMEDVSLHIDGGASKPIDFSAYNEDTKLDYGYCTEFILQLTNEKNGPATFDLGACIAFLETLGNSIVAFRDNNLVKVHVHTKTPDQAIAYALGFGDFLTFKMENMTLQHEEVLSRGASSHDETVTPLPKNVRKPISIVAVSPTEGFSKQFKEYGVPVIIQSTELMNPDSTDFINAFDQANADNIIVLPNNKNELMVAHQAAKLYNKSWIYVLETPDVMKGMCAAAVSDLADLSLEDNLSRMESAINKAHSISIAKASHGYRNGEVVVKKGDYIGILDGNIVAASEEIVTVFEETLQILPNLDDISLVTIFVGEDISEDMKAALEAVVSDIDPFIECCILEGGQHLYDVWASIE